MSLASNSRTSEDENSERNVRPRDAASLVVVRRHGGNLEVLLGKRAARHRFVPNVYVFPGGALDAQDARTTPASDLKAHVARRAARPGGIDKARALAVAAVRETFEETGLLFGRVDDDELRPSLEHLEFLGRAITPPRRPIRYHARFFLADARHATGELRPSDELPELRWATVSEGLRLPVIDVTEFMLHEIAAWAAGKRKLTGPAPLFSYRRGESAVRHG
jgi:8-oxo-dGTP pyrophosphatase MutT (NUDIX family)